MAKKISSKDLFESEDIFKGIRDSAEKTLLSLNKINDEFKQTAATLKQSLGDAKFDSSDSIKKFTQATAEANKIQKQSIEIQKLQEQVKQQAIKSEKEQERLAQERIKTQKAEAQEKSRLAAESAKQVKAAENEASGYAKLSKELNNARKAYKDLAVQNKENTAEGQQLLRQVTDLDAQLKKVDATVGQHQRNVGNYEGATKNLKTELRALTKELMNMSESDPKFQEMAQKAGQLKDQIQDTQGIVKATAGSAIENLGGAMNSVGQIGIAAFQGIESSMVLMGIENENILASMQKLQALAGLSDALSTLGAVGDKLTEASAGFMAFGTKAIGAFKGMTAASKAFTLTGIGLVITAIALVAANWDKLTGSTNKATQAQRLNNSVTKEATISISAELSAADKLSRQLKDETLSRKEKIQKVKEFQAAYPGLLSNMNAETNSIAQINAQLELNIGLLRLQAKQKAIQTKREEEYKKIIELETNVNEDNLGIIDKTKAKVMDFFGLGGQISTVETMGAVSRMNGVDAINANIGALDELDKSNMREMDALTKKGALLTSGSGAVKDYSQGLAGFTGNIDANTDALEKNRIEQERLLNLDKLRRESLDEIQAAESEYQDSLLSQQTQEENAVRDKYFILIEEAKKYGQDITILTEAQQKALTAIDKKYSDQRIAINKARLENILNQEEEFMNEYQTEINTDKQNEINSVNEKYFTLIEKAKQYGLDTKVLEEKQRKALADIDTKFSKDETDKAKKAAEERKKTIEQFANKTAEYFKKKSDEKIKAIDAEMAAAQKQSDALKELAANGNINAQQSLAENQRIIDQANLRKEKELKKQKRIEAGLAIFKLFSANADKKNPLAATIADTTGLLAFISSLPAFYDGTEDTGANGKGIDGKGGFHAVLHPNERVVPKSLNEQIGSMSNEQLTKIAQEYQNGRLIAKSNANSSLELAVLASKLDTLTDVIKNKPETNIALGEITQSAMNIVESKRTGNTTIYNRFRINK
jgi:hypothetical protein